jgi:hypothetical protein
MFRNISSDTLTYSNVPSSTSTFPAAIKAEANGISIYDPTFHLGFSPGELSSSLSSGMDGMQPVIDSIQTIGIDNVVKVDENVGITYDGYLSYMKIVTQVVTALFSVLLGCGSIGIIGLVLMTKLGKYGCRRLIFLIAFILFFFGFCTFILSIVFSFITPILYFACEFIEPTISSSTAFL